MPFIRKKRRDKYTTIPNTIVRDSRLSYKARGIFLYLWHLPDDWEISLRDLRQHSDQDGQNSVRSGVRELETYGYLAYRRVRKAGRFFDTEWTVDAEPPRLGKPNMVQPPLEKPRTPKDYRDPKTKIPPSPQRGARTARCNACPTPEALAVLRHLNTVTQRDYHSADQIQTLLTQGVSVEDCCVVIDFGWAVLRQERGDWYRQYFDNVTPFRPGNFDKYRARAVAWRQAQPRPVPPLPPAPDAVPDRALLRAEARKVLQTVWPDAYPDQTSAAGAEEEKQCSR